MKTLFSPTLAISCILPWMGTLALAAEPTGAGTNSVFLNSSKPLETRVADLISRLTLEQKAALLNHKGPTVTVEGHAIRADQWNQCLNGVQWNRPTTLFPVCVALAATWDPKFVQDEVARVLSDEARAIYNGWHLDPNAPGEHKGLIYRAPVINIERNPYWGRNHEAFGEDPFLTGRMAVAYVKGLQGDDPRHLKLAATLKHFAVNNVEASRMKLDAKVSQKMLHDYWLPHFRDAVVEGKACSLMASYNAINGTPNNINHWLLSELLKEDWKHEGFVVSDLGGVKTMVEGHEKGQMSYVDAVAKSLMAGCDFSDKEFEQNIPKAVQEGKLTPERLDDALTRVLRVRFRLGEFDSFESGPYSKISPQVVGSEKHRQVALKAAERSIVLLQNRDRLLPLDKAKLKKLAVIGPLADRVVRNNYNGRHDGLVSALAGIRNHLGPDVLVGYEAGSGVREAHGIPGTKVDLEGGFSAEASVKFEATAPGDFIEFTIGLPQEDSYQLKLIYKAFGERGVFQASMDGKEIGRPVDMFRAEQGYDEIADLGEMKLSAGKHLLRFTVVGKNDKSSGFPGHFDLLKLTGSKETELELENQKFTTGSKDEGGNALEKAVRLAAAADAAVVVVGTDETVEQEGLDRTSLGLPAAQERLVERILAANPRTIVIEMSAGPLTVPWLKQHVPAMLQAWWPGAEGGNAIAKVLFGEVNPAGRLPHTVYASEQQVPSLDEYDISKGFTYMYLKGEPLFPFGHGLSYTSFAYSDLQVPSGAISGEGSIPLRVAVKNDGDRAGDEVVQLYIRAKDGGEPTPLKQLRGFERVSLSRQEQRAISFDIPAAKLATYDEAKQAFVVKPGEYEIMVGSSSGDIRERATVRVAF